MVSLKSAPEVLNELARMVRMQRLNRKWTQAEMARRAGLKLPTYIVFERSGRISLLRFLKILDTLDLMTDLGELGTIKDLQAFTLADLKPERQRGSRTSK
jgi:transcriptional regulator with XRE-family HTH domain